MSVVGLLALPWDWGFFTENADELLAGMRRTLEASAIGIAGAFVIGLVLGAARAHRVPVVSQLAGIYVEAIRNTPILVQIFMLYFALPQVGIRLDAFTVAWLAVMIWGGAFNTENFRAGFEAVPVALPRGGPGARLRPALDVPQRHAADRRTDRTPVVDQHVHQRASRTPR